MFNMVIRTAVEGDYSKISKLFIDFFPIHNIFLRNVEEVVKYVREETKKYDLLVFEEKGIKAVLFLVNFSKNEDGSHKLWKFRHFAFTSEDYASKLLKEAEKRIKDNSKTAKIELTIAENEKDVEFYKKNGYVQEAVLKNHYRFGETCFVFGKTISN